MITVLLEATVLDCWKDNADVFETKLLAKEEFCEAELLISEEVYIGELLACEEVCTDKLPGSGTLDPVELEEVVDGIAEIVLEPEETENVLEARGIGADPFEEAALEVMLITLEED